MSDPMTTPPLDLTALREKLRITKVTDNAEVLALLDRVEELEALTSPRKSEAIASLVRSSTRLVLIERDDARKRAEVAEEALQRIENPLITKSLEGEAMELWSALNPDHGFTVPPPGWTSVALKARRLHRVTK